MMGDTLFMNAQRTAEMILAEIEACQAEQTKVMQREAELPRRRLGARDEPVVFAARQALAGASAQLQTAIDSLTSELREGEGEE